MNNIKRVLCVFMCAFCILVVSDVDVMAASPNSLEIASGEGISSPCLATPGSATFYIGENSNYTVIASSNSGIGRAVSVHVINFNASQYQADVMMAGRNGLIWSEDNCIGASGIRQFSCGNDVTYMYLRIRPKSSLFPAQPQTFRVEVVVGV